ncbi:MAG: hypothetical protein ACHQWU_02175 [Gemmatimonadales bacterium]
MTTGGWRLRFWLGVVMIGLGTYVALRPLWAHGTVLTGSRWLDMLFAAVFLLRGAVNIRSARARRGRAAAERAQPTE